MKSLSLMLLLLGGLCVPAWGQLTPDYNPLSTDDKDQEEFEKEYPELFATDAIIAYFGSENCPPCIPQKRMLEGKARTYHIAFYDLGTKRDLDLLLAWKIGVSTPKTIIVEKGEPVKIFKGRKSWNEIKPFAKKAKRQEPDRDRRRDRQPLRDFLKRFRDRT